jgi:hypothetical protein
MMLDANIVAVSPTSVWRVLGQAGLLSKWNGKPSKKGTGFEQPLAPHQHWHIDVSYINISGTFYYLCSVLYGYSRYIVNWDLRESMTEADIEIILERAKEFQPGTPLSLEDGRCVVEGYVEHYNNVRLNSAIATSHRRRCSPGFSRRSTPRGTGSLRQRGNNGRSVGGRPREE